MRREHLAPLALLLVPACASSNGTPPDGAPPQSTPAPAPVELPPDLDARLVRLENALEENRQNLNLAGLAAVVVHGDEVIWIGGLGQADRESGRPVEPGTLFQIGSTSKAFTSALVGQQVDAGRMDWDDPVKRHLPYFDPPVRDEEGRRATVRDLLCHWTGFTRQGLLWAGGAASREEILRTANGAEPWAAFRQQFLYNNVMYMAAGQATGAAAGTDWDTLLAERILGPLGMDSTSSKFDDVENDARLALGYRWNEEAEAFERDQRRNLDSIAPAGSIQSNVIDMAKWVRMLLAHGEFEGRRIVSSQALEEAWSTQVPLGPGVGYGLGWFVREWDGKRYVEHGGNIDGFCAQVSLLPDHGLGAVLLANVGASALQGTFGPLVFETLLGEAPVEEPTADESTEDFTRFLGKYIANFSHFRDAAFEVKVQNERLAVDIPGQMVFELHAPDDEGKRTFVFTDQIAIRFVENPEGAVEALELHQAGYTFEVPREGVEISPEVPLASLERYLGEYAHSAFPDPIDVRIQNNRLSVNVPGQQVYELRSPNDESVWVFRITPELGLEFHEDDQGNVDSLTFHERGTETLCRRVNAGSETLPLPTLEEVLEMTRGLSNEQVAATLGGSRMTGSMRFPQAGVAGKVTTLFDDRGRVRQEIEALPFAELGSGFDGETAWEASNLEPYDELEGSARRAAELDHPMALFGDWRKRFDSAQVLRTRTDAEGRERVIVRLKAPDDISFQLEVDVESGHILSGDTQEPIPGLGSLAVRIVFEDWREVDGLRLPFRVISENDASGRTVVQYEKLETRLELADEAFRYRP